MKPMSVLLVPCAVLFMPVLHSNANQVGKGLAFQLVKGISDYDTVRKMDVASIPLVDPPVFTAEDVQRYSRSQHYFELSTAGYARFSAVRPGTPFVIALDNVPLYSGVVWSWVRSSSVDGVVALRSLDGKDTRAYIRVGYPSASFFSGSDPRTDERLLDFLRQTGKLVE